MIYDTFIFFNELDLLEIRLNELDKVIDKFVLVESPITFSGKTKPLFFQLNKNRFTKFLPKINHIIVDRFDDINQLQNKLIDHLPQSVELLKRENIQRNAIMRGLSEAKKDDLVLISDVDEIPPPDMILMLKKNIKKNEVCGFKQKVFYYYLNLLSNETIIGTKMTYFENIDFPQNIRQTKKYILVDQGGWHFSFLGGVEKMREKIVSYSHQEYNRAEILSRIPFFVHNRLDIFERPYEYKMVPINHSFPKYLQQNKDHFKKFIVGNSDYDDNTEKLIQEIIRLRGVIIKKGDLEDKYKQIVDSKYFKLYPYYLIIKKLLKGPDK